MGLLVGLLLPAIQKVRVAALRTKSANNVRQIMLGMHNYAAANDSQMPGRTSWADSNLFNLSENMPIYIRIAPYLEVPVDRASFNPDKPETLIVPVYIDPGDPSWRAHPTLTDTDQGYCSYPVNVQAFGGPTRSLPNAYSDGLSNTIGIGGHYMRCGSGPGSQFQWDLVESPKSYKKRRATFADAWYDDVQPVTDDAGNTQPSRAGATFQTSPVVSDCDPAVPQSPYRAGLIVGMMDGSVRTIRPSVEPAVFWAAVTRNGGEVFSLD
jgi:hypothetical protein